MKTGNDSPPPTAAEPQHDLEAGIIDIDASSASAKGLAADEEEFSDPFDIGNTKNASHESLKRWRVS